MTALRCDPQRNRVSPRVVAATARPLVVEALNAALDLHSRRQKANGHAYCGQCQGTWPCLTAKTITAKLQLEPETTA